MKEFDLKRRGTCSVCPVLWEEGRREAPPYPDYISKRLYAITSYKN